MKKIKRVFTCVLCLAMLFALSLTALAVQNGSVTVMFEHENRPIAGAEFRLYQVAEMDGEGNYRLTDAFAEYPVTVSDLVGNNKPAAASVIAAYISRDSKISPDAQSETNLHGAAAMEELAEGIYLLTGDPINVDNERYIPLPSFVFIPSVDAEGNTLHDLTLMPKYEKRELTDGTLDRSVQKLWNDNEYRSHRPDEVRVWLLRNGNFYAEQVLNDDGNWRHTWKDLDASDIWSLIEVDVPEGYAVTLDQHDSVFTVTNTFADPNTPPDSSGDPTLPQTGLLWWPIPVLLTVGLIIFAVGYALKKSQNRNA